MVKKDTFENSPMGKAVIELSKEMQKRNMKPVSINVIGGFALMMNDIRNPNDMTDIDYVGEPLPDDFNKLADEIGIKHDLGRGWINNDVMLSNSSMDDFEFATGKLHFNQSMNVGNIKINVLDEKDVLRMKLIAIDTSLMAAEDGGDFSRAKDLSDVDKLLKRQNIECDQINEKFDEYIMDENTPAVIQAYRDGGRENAVRFVDDLSKKHREKLQQQREQMQQDTEGKDITQRFSSPYLDNLMNNLYTRLEQEKTSDTHDTYPTS